MPPLARQLRWYIAIRVVAVGSVLLAGFLIQVAAGPSTETLPPGFFLGLSGLTFAATLVYIALLQLLHKYYHLQAYIQFGGDLLLITALVYYAGGISSPFSLLYLIVIAVASTLLRRQAGISVASAAYLLYAGLLIGLYNRWIPSQGSSLTTQPELLWRLNYNLTVHFVGFYAVALLTSYLSQHVTRAERELEEKSEDLADLQVVHRDVIESISSGLVTTDLGGVITSVNRAGLAILAQPESALLGTPIQSSGFLSAERWAELTAASEQRRRLRSEVEVRRDGGATAFLGFSVSQLTDSFGTQRGYIVIFQDLTRWRLLQEEVRMKDRMAAVGELAAGLAHEIGNPLAAISGSVQMLSSAAAADGAQRKLIDILLKESQRLDRTIKGFLRFARPRERLSVRFDVARQLAENFELLRNSDEVSERHRLEIDLEPASAYLVADPDQVSQIFWNLARNALRAMPAGGALRVVGRLGDDCYRIEVKDTGRGMSEEQRANLFHPFQSFFDGGTGIGMAIVYRIVQEHGGHLGVDSRPGGGTTITVELPTAEAWANASGISAVPAETPG
jgi:two-component system, NtrC family, sensor histidine kinase PilS